MHCSHKEEWGAFEWSNIGQYTRYNVKWREKGCETGHDMPFVCTKRGRLKNMYVYACMGVNYIHILEGQLILLVAFGQLMRAGSLEGKFSLYILVWPFESWIIWIYYLYLYYLITFINFPKKCTNHLPSPNKIITKPFFKQCSKMKNQLLLSK